MIKKILVAIILFSVLCTLFQFQEGKARTKEVYLSYAPPATLQKMAFGYLTPLAAEMQYSTLMVYVGTILDRFGTTKLDSEQRALGYNFENIAKMYPHFIDTYYFCQAVMPYSSVRSAITASEILLFGEKTHTDSILLPFFAGFNYFYFAEQNEKAAEILLRTSQKENAPGWLGHLAAVLRAKDGNIRSGLFSLQVLLKTAQDEFEKERLLKDIYIFESALRVQEAIEKYQKDKGLKPVVLDSLVPDYIAEIPDVGKDFSLDWNGEKLRMVRPDKNKKNEDASFIPFLN